MTSDTTFSNYLLIVDAYSKIPKLYGMDNIISEEVIEKLDMFQSRSVKNRRIWVVVFRKNFSRCRYAIYLDGVQRIMPNLRILFDFIGSGTSGNEQTSQSDTENVV